MDVLEAIAARRSVRSYLPTPVPREVVEQLLDAAVRAPSGMNNQSWAFGVVEGVEAVRKLGERAKHHLLAHIDDNSPLVRYRERLEQPTTRLLYEAPLLIVIYKKPTGITREIDYCLAAQNLMLAACGLGLGTCWIGLAHAFLDLPPVKVELGVPDGYGVGAPLVVAYAEEGAPPVDRAAPHVLFWK